MVKDWCSPHRWGNQELVLTCLSSPTAWLYDTNAFKRRQILYQRHNILQAFRPDSLGKGWKSPNKPGFALQPLVRPPPRPPAGLLEQLSPLHCELRNSGVYSENTLPADTNNCSTASKEARPVSALLPLHKGNSQWTVQGDPTIEWKSARRVAAKPSQAGEKATSCCSDEAKRASA